MGVIGISFPSCTGILGGLYDKPVKKDIGFVQVSGHTGVIALDVNQYDQWNYIDFSGQAIYQKDIEYPVGQPVDGKDYEVPEHWDIANHRHDVKTNGGAIMKTPYESFNDFLNLKEVPEGEFVSDIPAADPSADLQSEDVKGKISVDMSGMMDGNIGYIASSINLEIEDWLVMYGGMPPSFKYSPNVYLVKLADGTYLGLKLQDYLNKMIDIVVDGEKKRASRKILSFEYFYPIEFKE